MQVELVDIVDRLSDVRNESQHDLSAVLGGTDDQRHGVGDLVKINGSGDHVTSTPLSAKQKEYCTQMFSFLPSVTPLLPHFSQVETAAAHLCRRCLVVGNTKPNKPLNDQSFSGLLS